MRENPEDTNNHSAYGLFLFLKKEEEAAIKETKKHMGELEEIIQA
ncbi:MAG: hypothetical protein PHS54_06535 [Clostridia bacterium]|nr:hypothetical protein [Clostridia bacterium]